MRRGLLLLVLTLLLTSNCADEAGVPTESPLAPAAKGGKAGRVTKIKIGTLPGDVNSAAQAINENGEVVGWSNSSSGVRAFFWATGGIENLGPGFAQDISNPGDVVGHGPGFNRRALVWQRQGASWNRIALPPYEVPVESGVHIDVANGIDDLGTLVVGGSSPDMGKNPDGVPIVCGIPVVWAPGTGWADATAYVLPTLDLGGPCEGLGSGSAFDVNDSGEIAGLSHTSDGITRAVVWTGSPGSYVVDPLPPDGVGLSWAFAINSTGVVAGLIEDVAGNRVGVTWTRAGSSWKVDTIGPDDALGLNDAGLVVGESSVSRQVAWYRPQDGVLTLLGCCRAWDANEANQIVGEERRGGPKAVLWTITQP